MRYAAVGLALVACGRIDFGPIASMTTDALESDDNDASHGAPTFVQYADFGSTSPTFAVTFMDPVAAGDLLVVTVGTSLEGVSTISDSMGNAFVMLPELSTAAISPMYVAWTIAIANGSDTVTAEIEGSDFGAIRAHEYANIAPEPFDTSVTNTGSDAGSDSIEVQIDTAVDHELVFAYAVSESAMASAGTGFTSRSTITGDVTEDAIESAAGAHAITATDSATPWAIEALAFKGL